MEIRRAILLFAIVLGLAALVTSFTRPTDEQDGDRGMRGSQPEADRGSGSRAEPRRPSSTDSPAAGPSELRFPAGASPVTRRLAVGRAATLTVEVLAPGQVAIDDLGLDGVAEPGTPARFDVLPNASGRHAITFTPVNGAEGRTIGVLRVRE